MYNSKKNNNDEMLKLMEMKNMRKINNVKTISMIKLNMMKQIMKRWMWWNKGNVENEEHEMFFQNKTWSNEEDDDNEDKQKSAKTVWIMKTSLRIMKLWTWWHL